MRHLVLRHMHSKLQLEALKYTILYAPGFPWIGKASMIGKAEKISIWLVSYRRTSAELGPLPTSADVRRTTSVPLGWAQVTRAERWSAVLSSVTSGSARIPWTTSCLPFSPAWQRGLTGLFMATEVLGSEHRGAWATGFAGKARRESERKHMSL